MRSRGPGLSRTLAAVACLMSAIVLAGCAGEDPIAHQSANVPSTSAPTPSSAEPTTPAAPTTRPSARPKVVPTSAATDSLGAHRVIPVPRSLAQQQAHRIVAVDGQATFLDSEIGTQPRPLLLVLAGLGEDAVTMRSDTGFTALGALSGFDVAYPEAPQDPATPPTMSPAAPAQRAVHATTAAVVTQAGQTTPRTDNSPAVPPESPAAPPSPASSPSLAPATPSPTPSPTTISPTPTPKASPSPTRKPSPTPTPSPSRSAPAKRPSPLNPGRRAWNAGSCCGPPSRDDVRYLVDVVHAVEATVPVDASRVYVVGFSNGGMMALDAVCSAPNVFAAAGSVSGPFLGSHCARPIWRHLAAAPDTVVPPGGGIPAGMPTMGVVRDWCGCSFPASSAETSRFGFFASVSVSPTGGHFWPTPSSSTWPYDPERDLWGYVSRFHL